MSKSTPFYCSKCNSEMIGRHGKNGFFYGCSNFPRCNYTSNKRFNGHAFQKDAIDNVVNHHFNTAKG